MSNYTLSIFTKGLVDTLVDMPIVSAYCLRVPASLLQNEDIDQLRGFRI